MNPFVSPRFGSSICFGITVGLWLAGLMDLAYVEVGIAMLLTVTVMKKMEPTLAAKDTAGLMLCRMYTQFFFFLASIRSKFEIIVNYTDFFQLQLLVKGILTKKNPWEEAHVFSGLKQPRRYGLLLGIS